MRTVLAGVAALGFLAAGVVPAVAGPEVAQLSIGIRGASGLSEVKLNCDPTDGSTHPDPKAACQALADADGDISAIAPSDIVCTMDINPVSVTIRGPWEDTFIDYRGEFPNRCVASAQTGGVIPDKA
ncbi:SSI family serine proteinase inhibitor [Actinokineospora auranticolor]|uniref:Subtilisin inhibitor-like n=1 Tax=Actinokineospora auranticolor TaxID=155976 RepID=A0A2S6GP90_9PSEU|nr:SSI family serine proteinase inhibitor [Actinokineospora auranticolor]PPK67048.1 subtilisin inhibitor-like [Actinokineospora auranticolor]